MPGDFDVNDSPDVLFLSPVMPAEGGNGLAMRAGLLLEGLARSHSVHVLVAPVFGSPTAPDRFVRRHASGFAALELDEPPDPRAELTALLATREGRRRAEALHPRPALCRRATPAAAEAVAAAADGRDAILVMRLYLAPFLDAVLERGQRPRLILDLDDIESAVHRGLGHHEEAERYERLERHYLPMFDSVITCSARDGEEIARRYAVGRSKVVPNAVRPPPVVQGSGQRHDLLFVGSLSYAPNVDAAGWLCREVMPLLDEATVALVGSRPAAEVRSLAAHPRITVAADVPTVTPWYAESTVAVAPLRAGGGTRIKVLEAFAHRRPVVATSHGVEGLVLAGEHGPVLIGETAPAFAAACRRLLDDPRLAAQLASRGEAIVRASATVEVVAGSIDRMLANMLEA